MPKRDEAIAEEGEGKGGQRPQKARAKTALEEEVDMLILLLALACADKGGEETGSPTETGDTGPTEGTLALTFAMDPDYIEIMDEEPVGRFWGSFWKDEEVTGAGPDEGAESLGDIYVESVDLAPDGGPTEVLFTSDALSGAVVVLGFVDSDGNADPKAPDPDDKDPVTLPGDNEFEVVPGEETVIQVYFGFLNP